MAEKSWEILEGACHSCKKCRLWEMRTNVVIGKGSRNADILFIGEGPGQQEDLQGVPFVALRDNYWIKCWQVSDFP